MPSKLTRQRARRSQDEGSPPCSARPGEERRPTAVPKARPEPGAHGGSRGGGAAATASRDRAGARLTRLHLVEPAGAGAQGDVWHATTPEGADVAIKVARDAEAVARLGAEALHLMLASSPQLPELVTLGRLEVGRDPDDTAGPDRLRAGAVGTVVEAATDDRARGAPSRAAPAPRSERPFAIVTSWIAGKSLESFAGTGPLDLDTVLRVAADTAAALGDLHAAGIAHGDVKPANLVLTPTGSVVLIDLGLAAAAEMPMPNGATPRYLATGDERLGDGRSRDLLALGIVLAELAAPEVRAAHDALSAARHAQLPAPVARICGPLLEPSPGARPSAQWVHDTALDAIAPCSSGTEPNAARQVRAHYLRLRRSELWHAQRVEPALAPWLGEAVRITRIVRQLGAPPPWPLAPVASPSRTLGPLDTQGRIEWVAALTASASVAWGTPALGRPTERRLAECLCALATRARPARWTLRDVERAAADALSPPPQRDAAAPETTARPGASGTGATDPAEPRALEGADEPTATGLTELALRIGRAPLDVAALEQVERLGLRAPAALRLAAADALRLTGELGRARVLARSVPHADAIEAEILRRCGDWKAAATIAREAVSQGRDPDGRALGCWARICLDRGQVERAAELARNPATAPVAEAAALAHGTMGELEQAAASAELAIALAATAEERARGWATLAYVRSATEPEEALRGFQAAVSHAVQAGAVLEEATYRTSEAALGVDLGRVEEALRSATRAAVLWEQVLGRPEMAARALLAEAAAHAAVGARHGAARAARLAIERAVGDPRAAAYAWWAVADVSPPGALEGADAARRAHEAIEQSKCSAALGASDDDVQAAARLWQHCPEGLQESGRRRFDEAASFDGPMGAHAKLAWWGARAARLARAATDADRADSLAVVEMLARLATERTPVGPTARAMHAGRTLAASIGEPVLARQLEHARERAAAVLRASCRETLADAAAECAWVVPVEPGSLDWSQARDLQRLVRALGERGNVRALLTQVLDVMLEWTGAERGLVLLRDSRGELAPRAARNLQREDLAAEQLAVSRSLAERALATGRPVVAVDAMDELGERYASVHALRLRSVLVAPLVARGELLGVVYLDDRARRAAFGPREVGWAESVAPVAALAISDAAAQAQLRRRVRRAERSSAELENALARHQTALEVAERELAQMVDRRSTRFAYDEIVGESVPIKTMLQLVDRVSVADVPVLLRGESGSGKELVARAIHRHSGRASAPFVSENCAAVPESLLESVLFGHVRGAFTSAVRSRVGLFEAAHGGTLFLDEIGEMTQGMQTRLLRVLEEGELRPVGSDRSRKVDVRVIAATHRDLERMVREGAFREDLYYRLNVVALTIPPLRDRPEDVPLLVRHFLALHARSASGREDAQPPGVTPRAVEALSSYEWPGNVRQLENEVRRAILLSDGVIDVEGLSSAIQQALARQAPSAHRARTRGEPPGLSVRARVDQLEVDLVRQALEKTGGNQTQAAKLLGISRYGLHKMMQRLGLRRSRSDRAERS